MPGRKPDMPCEMWHDEMPVPAAVEHIRVTNYNPYASEGLDLSSQGGRVEGKNEIYEYNVCEDHGDSRRATARNSRGKLKIQGLGVPRRYDDAELKVRGIVLKG